MRTFIIVLCLINKFAFGQKVVTTYYDWQKTKKKEVYQTDANGTRNGNYKNFDEQGGLRNEGTFKFGKQHGVFIEYTKFPNYAGTMQIKTKETYVNDLKEGPAVYYNYNKEIGVYELQKGNYKEDKEEGVWTKITPFDKILATEDYDYIKSIPAFKGSMFVKESITYSKGEITAPAAGKNESYYYPSNKIYSSKTYNGGPYPVEELYSYPDGKIWAKNTYDEYTIPISKESYYYDGKLKIKETSYPFTYESYNPDGTEDKKAMDYMKQVNFYRQKKAQEEAKLFSEDAWKQLLEKDFNGALASCKAGLKNDPTYLYLYGNLAHAYLFLGDYDKAIAIYKKYLDQKLDDKLTWNDMIKQDFAEFKSKGIESDGMDKILGELNLK